MKVLLPEPWQLEGLRRVMKRLYSEDRMTGDEMRDAAQTIEAILRTETDLDD